ncbi:uncharacterized protein RJT21DRAFT_19697 [Scheffersomyces amazonensis]|uniref:uncharacterized protein n=1 Tax=Scheffersomyces amazonensis TaxID=1078765 RepID=UPI00315DB234
MKMKIRQIFLVLTFSITFVTALQTVPVIVASHKLVPELKSEINADNIEAHNVTSVTNMLKKLITACSSDEYLLVNIPGLQLDDITDNKVEQWPFVSNYLKMASSLVGLPWVHGTLDFQFLERYIIRNCQAEAVYVNSVNHEEVAPYYDVRTRVIVVNLPPLPIDGSRDGTLKEYDELIRKIIRKLPSPHYTLLITSDVTTTTHPVPHTFIRSNPDRFEIFNNIINHSSRATEYERNDNVKNVDPIWHKPKHTNDRYLRNKKKDEIHFFRDNELWMKYQQLVTTVIVMILGLFMMKIISIFGNIKQWIIDKKRKNQLIIEKNKKHD